MDVPRIASGDPTKTNLSLLVSCWLSYNLLRFTTPFGEYLIFEGFPAYSGILHSNYLLLEHS